MGRRARPTRCRRRQPFGGLPLATAKYDAIGVKASAPAVAFGRSDQETGLRSNLLIIIITSLRRKTAPSHVATIYRTIRLVHGLMVGLWREPDDPSRLAWAFSGDPREALAVVPETVSYSHKDS
jgi:hypothetical protein